MRKGIVLSYAIAAILTLGIYAPPARAKKDSQQRVNLNAATEAELEALPGVGPATAKKIIGGRPYQTVDDVLKAGVAQGTLNRFRDQVTVGATADQSPLPRPGRANRLGRNPGTDGRSEKDAAPQQVNLNTAP